MTDITANQEKQSSIEFQKILSAIGKCISAAESSPIFPNNFKVEEFDEFKILQAILDDLPPNEHLQRHFDCTVNDIGHTFMQGVDFFLYCIWNDDTVDIDSRERMEHMHREVIGEILFRGYSLKGMLLEHLYSSSIIDMAGMPNRVAQRLAERDNNRMEENTAPALKKIKKPGRI